MLKILGIIIVIIGIIMIVAGFIGSFIMEYLSNSQFIAQCILLFGPFVWMIGLFIYGSTTTVEKYEIQSRVENLSDVENIWYTNEETGELKFTKLDINEITILPTLKENEKPYIECYTNGFGHEDIKIYISENIVDNLK